MQIGLVLLIFKDNILLILNGYVRIKGIKIKNAELRNKGPWTREKPSYHDAIPAITHPIFHLSNSFTVICIFLSTGYTF